MTRGPHAKEQDTTYQQLSHEQDMRWLLVPTELQRFQSQVWRERRVKANQDFTESRARLEKLRGFVLTLLADVATCLPLGSQPHPVRESCCSNPPSWGDL